MVNTKSRPKRPEFWRNGRHFDNPEDLVGQEVGQLRVVKFLRREENGDINTYYYECLCSCGVLIETTRWKLITTHTLSCGCRKKRTGDNNPSWKGYRDLSGRYWNEIRNRALNSGKTFTLTIEEAWALYETQSGKCALSGLPIPLKEVWDQKKRSYGSTKVASLDRIDSQIGYVLGNIQWVHKSINRMKSNFPEAEFIEMCKAVATYNVVKPEVKP